MTATIEPLFEALARHRLLPPSELHRLRDRWFKPGRAEVDNPEKFGQWAVANGFLTSFVVRMLREGKANLLRLNQYQLTELLSSGPFRGGYRAIDPVGRQVVLEVLATRYASDAETLRAYQELAERSLAVNHANVARTLDFGQAHGRHFLVREHTDGSTLGDILSRRGRLQPVTAARLFALALAGLHAVHEAKVPAGELNEDALVLATMEGSANAKIRTVKILHAGVPRSLFDAEALEGNDLSNGPASAGALAPASPEDDLLRLGTVFYRALTGQAPGAAADGKPVPVCTMAPEVPDILGEIVDQMLSPDPSQRSRSAAHVAKRLRIFLASEEEGREERAEEYLAQPAAAPASPPKEAAQPPEEEADKEASAAPAGPVPAGARGKLSELWQEIRPSQRELFYLGAGAGAAILVLLLISLMVDISFVNVVCLLTGGALSFLVEQWLRVREEQLE